MQKLLGLALFRILGACKHSSSRATTYRPFLIVPKFWYYNLNFNVAADYKKPIMLCYFIKPNLDTSMPVNVNTFAEASKQWIKGPDYLVALQWGNERKWRHISAWCRLHHVLAAHTRHPKSFQKRKGVLKFRFEVQIHWLPICLTQREHGFCVGIMDQLRQSCNFISDVDDPLWPRGDDYRKRALLRSSSSASSRAPSSRTIDTSPIHSSPRNVD